MHFRASGVVSTWMRADDGAQSAGVEFGTAVPGPTVGQVGPGAVDGFGDVAQVLLGVVDVNDLDGAGKLSAATFQIHAAVAAPGGPRCRRLLAMDTLGDGRRGSVSRLAADRGVRATRGRARAGLAPFGRPHGGRTSRVLAEPSGCLPPRPSTSVGRTGTPLPSSPRYIVGRGGDGFGHSAFVGGDRTSQGFGAALDLLGLARTAASSHNRLGCGEAGVGGRQPHQPQHAGRQRRGVHTQGPVARTHPRTADVAMVVGPFQRQRPEQRDEGLRAAAGKARPSAPQATVESEGSASACASASAARSRTRPQGLLKGLEVLRGGPPWSEQRSNFSRKRGYERGAETVFTAWLAVASARR